MIFYFVVVVFLLFNCWVNWYDIEVFFIRGYIKIIVVCYMLIGWLCLWNKILNRKWSVLGRIL